MNSHLDGRFLPQRMVWSVTAKDRGRLFRERLDPPRLEGQPLPGGGIGRHAKQIANSGPAGELVIKVDLTALPRPNGTHSVVAGETWNFQCWFGDKVAGANTSNFTDGIEIVFK